MKKLIILITALAMILTPGYTTLASTIGIGVSEGFSFEIGKYVAPSGNDDIDISGYYGISKQLLFSVGYGTDSKDLNLGTRYAFTDNMAVTLDFIIPDADYQDDTATFGIRYKVKISDALALAGIFNYTNTNPEATLGLFGQAEYIFTEKVVGTLGFDYSDDGANDGANPETNIVIGIETYPTEKLYAYLDYTIYEDENTDNEAYLGIGYVF